MSLLATIECFDTFWIAEQGFGKSERHEYIAAGAHRRRKPYCRRRVNGPQERGKDPLPRRLIDVLLREEFDLSRGAADLMVVQHNLKKDQDPAHQLEQLQMYGRQLLTTATECIPDHAFLGKLTLSPCEMDDLRIAKAARTRMMFNIHEDSPHIFKTVQK